MGIFFVDWDLWQEMTFVLACCIIIVFGIGFVKLWWTNRALRRLEVIDEEKRARTLEIRQCGIDTWGANDIPFGIRAIQSGIEVDGIWISRPYDHDFSHIASSTTLVGEQSEFVKAKGMRRSRYTSGSSTIDEALSADPLLPPASPVLAALDGPMGCSNGATQHPDSGTIRTETHVDTYTPTGMHESRQKTDEVEPDAVKFRPSKLSTIASSRVTETHPAAAESAPYGTAEVYVNRDTRRTNRGFEVLPAGMLGSRQELSRPPSVKGVKLVAEERHRPSKLRKNRPPNETGRPSNKSNK